MRVISGLYKGRKLVCPEGDKVRPTSDKVKECVFDILQFSLQDKVFVDLFSGCGGMGIEALSRGASKAYFVDNSRQSLHYIKENIQTVGATNYEIVAQDYKLALSKIKGADYIYADPPYAETEIYQTILQTAFPCLKEGGEIFVEHQSAMKIESIQGYVLKSVRKYGYIGISIFKKESL